MRIIILCSVLSLTSLTFAQHHIYTLNANNSGYGTPVSGAGDVNQDGYADFIVASLDDNTNGSDAGMARVYSGSNSSILYSFFGDSAFDQFGSSVSGAGDVNSDGYADLIVGAPEDNTNGPYSGRGRVFSGVSGAVLYTFDGDSGSDRLGWSVSGAGDVNQDGYADLIVGAYGDNSNGVASGSAYLYSGKSGSILTSFIGDSAGDTFGWSVSGAGDVNGDGYADLIVGAPHDAPNGIDSGMARVLSGKSGGVLYTFDGDSSNDFFGEWVSEAGDVNQDGYADLIVGDARSLPHGMRRNPASDRPRNRKKG